MLATVRNALVGGLPNIHIAMHALASAYTLLNCQYRTVQPYELGRLHVIPSPHTTLCVSLLYLCSPIPTQSLAGTTTLCMQGLYTPQATATLKKTHPAQCLFLFMQKSNTVTEANLLIPSNHRIGK